MDVLIYVVESVACDRMTQIVTGIQWCWWNDEVVVYG